MRRRDTTEVYRGKESDIPRAGVWTDEIDRARDASGSGASYSVDTLSRARRWLDEQGLSGCMLRLLIGADQAVASSGSTRCCSGT